MEKELKKIKVFTRILFLVADSVSDIHYRGKIKQCTLDLVEHFAQKNMIKFEQAILMLDILVDGAVELGYVAKENHIVLHRELEVFKKDFLALVRGGVFVSGIPEIDKNIPEKHSEPSIIVQRMHSTREGIEESLRIPVSAITGELTPRQHSLLELVRQRENVRLMDVLVHFPNFNEKTIRNDLKLLCERGHIVRIGNGGRGSRYQPSLE